jgi:hypothetical protein
MMLNRVVLVCQGETAAPHRAEFVFDRDDNDRWTSLFHECVDESIQDPRGRVMSLIESGVPWETVDGHHVITDVNGNEHYRVRGGVRETKRGYEVECWKRHSDARRGLYALPFSILFPALDGLAHQGIAEFDVADLLRRVRR